MKKLIYSVCVFVSLSTVSCVNTQNNIQRDYEYERYCDSIWYADKDYYMDILVESDEYQKYMEIHGQWWDEEDNDPAYRELEAANNFKRELLEVHEKCIQRIDSVLEKKNIHDEKYEELKCTIDSLLATQL